jgi:hypothetical protein
MLRDIVKLSTELIKPIWPSATYNQLNHTWTFKPGGETLEFFHYDETPSAFDNVQGRQFAFIGWEEITIFKSLEGYLKLFSCLRSTALPGMPRKVRATANPLGRAHNAVKHRFRLRGVPEGICGPAIVDALGEDGKAEAPRRAIHFSFEDNVLLRRTEPEYMRSIVTACQNDQARLRAWTRGDWDVVSGGAFDGIMFEHSKTIKIPRFELPMGAKLFMSYDHGSSKPFSTGFWFESEGEDLILEDGRRMSTIRGDLFRIGEVYGCVPGKIDTGLKLPIAEIVKRIQEYKIARGWRHRDPMSGKWFDFCKTGVADSSIFDEMNEFSVAVEMEQPVTINGQVMPGIQWTRALKEKGSRQAGYLLMCERMIGTQRPREAKGLFVVAKDCPAFLETIPTLARSEKTDDGVADDQCDHVFDETRYALSYAANQAPTVVFSGSISSYNEMRRRTRI